MRLLDLVHRTRADRGVPHALVGAAALAACGIARSTFDVDLLVEARRRWTRIIGARSASDLTAPPVHPPEER